MQAKSAMPISELTVEELRSLIKETVSEAFQTLLISNDLGDPDLGMQIRPEIEAQLCKSLEHTRQGERGEPAAVVAEKLGLDWDSL
ncbi:MAG: hypothetical protein AAF050_21160 [Cyanobacteria bacterium J06649_5]